MDEPPGNHVVKIHIDPRQFLGEDFLQKLAPGQPINQPSEPVNNLSDENEQVQYYSQEINETEDEDGIEDKVQKLNTSNPNPTPRKLSIPLSFTFKHPNDFPHSKSAVDHSVIKFGTLDALFSPPAEEEDRNYPVFNQKIVHWKGEHLKKEKVTMSDFFADIEFVRQSPKPEPEQPVRPPLNSTNPFMTTSNSKQILKTLSTIDPSKRISFFDWNAKQKLSAMKSDDKMPSKLISQTKTTQEDLTQTDELDERKSHSKRDQEPKVNKSVRKSTRQISSVHMTHIDSNEDFFDWNSKKSSKGKTSVSGQTSPLQKSRVDAETGINFFDWQSVPLTSVSHTSDETTRVSASNANIEILVDHKDAETMTKTTSQLTAKAILKSKASKTEMASVWDNYQPPSPTSFPNCHVDSGNVDALVSQVLQRCPAPPQKKLEDESLQDFDNCFRRNSQFFNPGISINFNYNPVFSNDTTWTWNHQHPPGSPSQTSSAYFPTSKVSTPTLHSTECQTEEKEAINYPPFLRELSSYGSDISLVPMVDSKPSLSPPSDLSPEDIDSEAENFSSKKSLMRSAKSGASKQVNPAAADLLSPLGCRIIAILNQFNKLGEDETFNSNSGAAESVSNSVQNHSIPQGHRNNHTLGSAPKITKIAKSKPNSANSNSSNRGQGVPKSSRSSTEFKRNIIQENIILAKYPSRRPNLRSMIQNYENRHDLQRPSRHTNMPIIVPILSRTLVCSRASSRTMSSQSSVRVAAPPSRLASQRTVNRNRNRGSQFRNQQSRNIAIAAKPTSFQAQAQNSARLSTSRNRQPQNSQSQQRLQQSNARLESLSRNIFRGTFIDTRRTTANMPNVRSCSRNKIQQERRRSMVRMPANSSSRVRIAPRPHKVKPLQSHRQIPTQTLTTSNFSQNNLTTRHPNVKIIRGNSLWTRQI